MASGIIGAPRLAKDRGVMSSQRHLLLFQAPRCFANNALHGGDSSAR
jgi:hypothetical protein